jgi:hypothetical protein
MIGCAQLSLRLGKLGRVDEHGRVQPDDMGLDARFARRGKPWCADLDGYSLHAGVTVRGDDDVGRENLCRYVLRHPISLSRLSLTSDGRVAYEMKYPRGSRTHQRAEAGRGRSNPISHRGLHHPQVPSEPYGGNLQVRLRGGSGWATARGYPTVGYP